MSLPNHTADYEPGMHTTALSVVHANADFLRCKGKAFRF